MSKEINVEEAADWDDEEAALNDRYLRDRGRDAEADKANEIRGDKSTNPDASGPETVPEGNIDAVLDWVGDDPERAKQALDAENASEKPRVSLTDALEAKLEG